MIIWAIVICVHMTCSHLLIVLFSFRLYRYIYQWTAQAEPQWELEDLPVVPLLGYLETGIEVRVIVTTWLGKEQEGKKSRLPSTTSA